ncbi:YciI family protein [Sphingomonas sp.]|uniref:YciI family protein n=1 Tax=Sphingomonas sp. TaxID=28214 RepID=UPI0025E51F99|nr:YciI family protein [Sphingomonas sp.]MBV9527379.1 hypothetical protein [Sphingomonas sp.]
MRFVWIGFMKAGADADQRILQQETGFLQQPYIKILSAGALRDEDGRRLGMMMIFETEDRSTAEALVAGSPFRRAGLYEHYHLAEFLDEVG